jgi:putative oxidoreductase
MQRYFSAFPDSWPGFALLLLRMLLSGDALSEFMNALSLAALFGVAGAITLSVIAGGLLIGLWTPVCAMLLAMIECCAMLAAQWDTHGARAVVAMSVAMLGPGAWSLDARLYGRKVVTMAGPDE